jgi:hypothetical protein
MNMIPSCEIYANSGYLRAGMLRKNRLQLGAGTAPNPRQFIL